MTPIADLNELAAWTYQNARVTGLPSPLQMAPHLGVKLYAIPVGGGAVLMGDTIVWDPTPTMARQRALMLREIARWVLRLHGYGGDTETSLMLAKATNAYACRRLTVCLVGAERGQTANDVRPVAKVHDWPRPRRRARPA